MARIHARKRGKSRSKPPVTKEAPKWVEMKPSEIDEVILKLSKEGNSSAKIGLTLRDQYGVPSVKAVTGKSIVKIIEAKEGRSDYPEDFMNLLRKAVGLRKHLVSNTRDTLNKHSLALIESKIKRLEKYYKKKGILPEDFYYDPEKAALMIR
jgi:small subunit ribosomal protein S15